MDKEILKLKVNSLISLRTSLINTLTVLVGGTVGVYFLPAGSVAKIILIIVGIFYSLVFSSNLISTSGEISNLLNNGKE